MNLKDHPAASTSSVPSLSSFRVLKTNRNFLLHLLFTVMLYRDWRDPDKLFTSPIWLATLCQYRRCVKRTLLKSRLPPVWIWQYPFLTNLWLSLWKVYLCLNPQRYVIEYPFQNHFFPGMPCFVTCPDHDNSLVKHLFCLRPLKGNWYYSIWSLAYRVSWAHACSPKLLQVFRGLMSYVL